MTKKMDFREWYYLQEVLDKKTEDGVLKQILKKYPYLSYDHLQDLKQEIERLKNDKKTYGWPEVSKVLSNTVILKKTKKIVAR